MWMKNSLDPDLSIWIYTVTKTRVQNFEKVLHKVCLFDQKLEKSFYKNFFSCKIISVIDCYISFLDAG